LPEIFTGIHKQRLTPIPSLVLEGLLGIAMCIPSNIEGLIEFFSFVAWIFYGLTFVGTLCCKFTMKDAERVISVSPQ
jgi:L-type amino acid transporter 9